MSGCVVISLKKTQTSGCDGTAALQASGAVWRHGERAVMKFHHHGDIMNFMGISCILYINIYIYIIYIYTPNYVCIYILYLYYIYIY